MDPETLPRDSASPEDCSHVGALQVLVTALHSKRPSAWTIFTSWCCTCCGEKSMWRARRQNLLRGSCDPASSYTPTSPIQYHVGLPSLDSARSSRFWGWWWRTLVVQFYILSKGLPTTVLQTRLWIAFMGVGVFGENRRRNWDDYSLNNVVYNALSIVKYMYSIARQVADGLRRVDAVRSVHQEDSFQKNQRFGNKNGMSTEDLNTGAKWTAHLIWQTGKAKETTRLSVINHTCTTNRNFWQM